MELTASNVIKSLSEIAPYIEADGGYVEFVEIEEETKFVIDLYFTKLNSMESFLDNELFDELVELGKIFKNIRMSNTNIFDKRLDELHENTYKHKKEEKRLFDEHVINIAKKDGLVFDEYKLDTKFYPTLVSAILKDQKDEDHLFALKLALFENETINSSDNAELKAEIRKGKSKIEVLQAALKLFSEK